MSDTGMAEQWMTEGLHEYNSYSGTDIVATITMPNGEPMVFAELQTVSYSIHRENTPVRTIGHVSPLGFVKGQRTIAGSLIFTVFNEYAFYRIRRFSEAIGDGFYPLADMMPPFDITLTFSDEYGSLSSMKIFGISIIDEGGTMSIDDMVTESTMTYIARGIQPMVNQRRDRETMLPISKSMSPATLSSSKSSSVMRFF